MAYQAVPNVAQVQCIGVVDSQMTVNDISFEISGGGINITNLTVLASAVALWFSNTLAPLLSENWSAQRVSAVDLTTQTGPAVVIGASTPGGVSGEAAPNNVAACVSFRTAGRGRSSRGRNYVPGIPNSLVTLNTLDGGFIGDLEGAYQDLVGPGTFLAGWQFVVVSRQTGGVLRPTGVPSPVTSVTMTTDKVKSMRSRSVGHGA
jgi:hypothetical protein